MQLLLPPDDFLIRFLEQCQLPTSDIRSRTSSFFGYVRETQIQGVVGLEYYENIALLRSLAVLPLYRKQGIGKALVSYAQEIASSQGISELFLLTNTAKSFFQNQGYGLYERSQAPLAIQNSTQFSSLCPQSASLMQKSLKLH
jgi:amino-acid N-acetyltransferase